MLYYYLYPLHETISGFNVFRYITFRSIGGALTAFLLMLLLGPFFIRLMKRLQIGQVVRDNGPASHLKKQGVPTMGGMLIILTITLSTLIWVRLDNALIWISLFMLIFYGVIGAIDDLEKITKGNSKGLSPRGKLVLQSAGAAFVGGFILIHPGFDGHLSFPFLKDFNPDLGWFYVIFAIFVIVGASNAVNITDGLDGLASGPAVVSSAVYLVFAYLAGNKVLAGYLHLPYVAGSGELSILCGAMFGAVLGFLWFNAFPAQMFMGDVGSLSLGGALGTIAIIIKQEFLLAIVGGIFVLEVLSVIIQVGYFRISGGKRFFLMAPFHHHFEKKGWHETKVVVRFWIVAVIFGLFALATLKLR